MEVSSAVNRHGRRLPVRRAFVGLAGSPLASVITEPEPEPKPPLSNAERQRLFRERRGEAGKKKDANRKVAARTAEKVKRETGILRPGLINGTDPDPDWLALAPHPSQLKKWNKVVAKQGLADSNGLFMRDADRGKGLLVTGGYDPAHCDEVRGAHETEDGRVKLGGCGEATEFCAVGFSKSGKPYSLAVDTPTFYVNIRDGLADWKLAKLMARLIERHFTTVPAIETIVSTSGDLIFEGTPEMYLCRRCMFETDWPNDRGAHILEEHDELIRSARYGRKEKAV